MVPRYIVLGVLFYLKPFETKIVPGDIFSKTTNIQKREIQQNQKFDFILEKLTQHTQALEHLVKIVEESEQILKQIVEFISTKLESPQMPDKIEVLTPSRRSYIVENEDPDPPIIKFGENMRRYGSLIKSLILKELNNEPDPLVYIENDIPRMKET